MADAQSPLYDLWFKTIPGFFSGMLPPGAQAGPSPSDAATTGESAPASSVEQLAGILGTMNTMLGKLYEMWMPLLQRGDLAGTSLESLASANAEHLRQFQQAFMRPDMSWPQLEAFANFAPLAQSYAKMMPFGENFAGMMPQNFAAMLPLAQNFAGMMPFGQNFAGMMPQNFATMMAAPQSFAGMQPFAGMAPLMQSWSSSLAALTNTHAPWRTSNPLRIGMERTFGGLADAFGLGATRQFDLAWRELLAAGMSKQHAQAEYLVVVGEAWNEGTQRLMKRLREMSERGERVDSFLAFIRLWARSVDGAMHEAMQSERGLQATAKVLRAATEFRQHIQSVVKLVSEALFVPTRSDMDEAYREIQELKRRLRRLEKSVEQAHQAAPAAAPKRHAKPNGARKAAKPKAAAEAASPPPNEANPSNDANEATA
jgi:class III poly(R)-hydroxyalkanoic acid synthase PhaE subunit